MDGTERSQLRGKQLSEEATRKEPVGGIYLKNSVKIGTEESSKSLLLELKATEFMTL